MAEWIPGSNAAAVGLFTSWPFSAIGTGLAQGGLVPGVSGNQAASIYQAEGKSFGAWQPSWGQPIDANNLNPLNPKNWGWAIPLLAILLLIIFVAMYAKGLGGRGL